MQIKAESSHFPSYICLSFALPCSACCWCSLGPFVQAASHSKKAESTRCEWELWAWTHCCCYYCYHSSGNQFDGDLALCNLFCWFNLVYMKCGSTIKWRALDGGFHPKVQPDLINAGVLWSKVYKLWIWTSCLNALGVQNVMQSPFQSVEGLCLHVGSSSHCSCTHNAVYWVLNLERGQNALWALWAVRQAQVNSKMDPLGFWVLTPFHICKIRGQCQDWKPWGASHWPQIHTVVLLRYSCTDQSMSLTHKVHELVQGEASGCQAARGTGTVHLCFYYYPPFQYPAPETHSLNAQRDITRLLFKLRKTVC